MRKSVWNASTAIRGNEAKVPEKRNSITQISESTQYVVLQKQGYVDVMMLNAQGSRTTGRPGLLTDIPPVSKVRLEVDRHRYLEQLQNSVHVEISALTRRVRRPCEVVIDTQHSCSIWHDLHYSS